LGDAKKNFSAHRRTRRGHPPKANSDVRSRDEAVLAVYHAAKIRVPGWFAGRDLKATLAETRVPIPMKPGVTGPFEYE